jgi:hypothetical protein
MVGGTSFHRGILKASVGRVSTKSKSKTKSCLRSQNKNLGFGPTARVAPPQTLYVSLDNADSVIEGGPPFPGVALECIGELGSTFDLLSLEQPRQKGASSLRFL